MSTDTKSAIELLQWMVRIPSISGNELGLGNFLYDLAHSWRLDAQRLPIPGQHDQILIGVEASRSDAPLVLFDSHMDTVAVDGMTIDPYSGDVDAGRLFGRGSCDTKGTGAAMLTALREYSEQRDRPNRVAMICAVHEETDMCGIRQFVKHDLPMLGWMPDAVIVGEPTEFHPVIAHNGLLRCTITTRGVAAHSSRPQEGVSAISAMVKVVAALEGQYIPGVTATDDLTGSAACSINTIRGGSADNIIPDHCTVTLDRRLTPAEDTDREIAAIDAVIHAAGDSAERIEATRHPPLTTKHNTALVERCVAVLGEMKLPKMTMGAPFATHAAYFDAVGLPAVVLGPGDPHKAHTKDESVEVAQIERGVELYLRLMNGGC